MSARLETSVTFPFSLFSFSYPLSKILCFYFGNLMYSYVFPSFLSPLYHHFLLLPQLFKSTEFATSFPSGFPLQSDLQTAVLLLFIKHSSIYFCLQVFYSMVYFKGDRYITIHCVQIFLKKMLSDLLEWASMNCINEVGLWIIPSLKKYLFFFSSFSLKSTHCKSQTDHGAFPNSKGHWIFFLSRLLCYFCVLITQAS